LKTYPCGFKHNFRDPNVFSFTANKTALYFLKMYDDATENSYPW
jgi:hypothetical protein